MSWLETIESGNLGIRLVIPDGFSPFEEQEHTARFRSDTRGYGLTIGIFPHRLDLQAKHEALLRNDIHRHARDLFESCFRTTPPSDNETKPRTQDPSYTPVIEISRERVGGVDALWLIHRLWYEPGKEVLMGHLLIPLARSLLEIRVIPPRPQMTGFRESTILAKAMAEERDANPVDLMKRLGQGAYDDPKWDHAFPTHPLTLTREGRKCLLEEMRIEVLEPAQSNEAGEEELEELGLALTPPARYLRNMQMKEGETGKARAVYSRVSFSGTDGLQLLTISRPKTNIGKPSPSAFLKVAERAAESSVPQSASSVSLSGRLVKTNGVFHAETYRAYVEEGLAQHAIFRWIPEPDGSIVLLSLSTSQCVPREEIEAQIEDVALSVRPLRGSRQKDKAQTKKWWQIL